MKLSVIIPCYNERLTIEKIVTSVLDSSIADKEVIIVDDFSTDGTRKILKDKIGVTVSGQFGVLSNIIYWDKKLEINQ